MLENKKIDLLEFKNFVNETVKEELEDYSTEELEDFVNDNLDYDILVEIAYKDFIKGYNATAKEAIINEVFYN